MILVWLLDEAEQRRDKATRRRQPGSGSDLLQVAANVGHLHVAAVMVPALQKVKCHPASPFCLPPRSLRNGSRKLFCPPTITGVKKKNSTIARRAARLAERASVHGMPSPVFDFLTSLHVLRPLVPWGRRTKLSGGRRIHCRETVFHFKELAVNGFLKCSIWTLQHLVSASWRE